MDAIISGEARESLRQHLEGAQPTPVISLSKPLLWLSIEVALGDRYAKEALHQTWTSEPGSRWP